MATEQPGCECKLKANEHLKDYKSLNLEFTKQNKLITNRLKRATQDNLKLQNKLFVEQQKSSTLQNTINYIYEQVSSSNENVTSILKKYVTKPKSKSPGIDAASIQNKSPSFKIPKLSAFGKKKKKTESGLETIGEEDNSNADEATSDPLNVTAICTQMPNYNERRKMKRHISSPIVKVDKEEKSPAKIHDGPNDKHSPLKKEKQIKEDSVILSDVTAETQSHKDVQEKESKAKRSLFATKQKDSKKRSSENISSDAQTVESDNQKIDLTPKSPEVPYKTRRSSSRLSMKQQPIIYAEPNLYSKLRQP